VAVLANVVLRNKHVAYVFSIGTAAGLFYLYSNGYNHWLYNRFFMACGPTLILQARITPRSWSIEFIGLRLPALVSCWATSCFNVNQNFLDIMTIPE
jgi:hypothetical protein